MKKIALLALIIAVIVIAGIAGMLAFFEEFVPMMDDAGLAFYTPFDEKVIPKVDSVPPVSPEIIPPDLAAFFDNFDLDRDRKIDIGEAQDFFYWVEDNIGYRWDGEEDHLLHDFIPGDPVGDGRPDGQYSQTPHETWTERAGDCEDTATLQVAFFNHFGSSAYVATVATQPSGVVDHAIAVVYIADSAESAEEFAKLLGGVITYEINGKHYILVDNTHSDKFGDLSGGLERGTFYMVPWIDGQYLFSLEEMFEKDRRIREGW